MDNKNSSEINTIKNETISKLKDNNEIINNVNNDNSLDEELLKNEDIKKTESNSSKYEKAFDENNSSSSSKDVRIKNKSTISKNDFENDKFISKQNSQNFAKEDFIKPKDWNYTNDINIFELEQKYQEIQNSINLSEYNSLQTSIKKCNLDYIFKNDNLTYNVGPISTLESLVESNFVYDVTRKEDMYIHILMLEKYLYRWRLINGDGNCFYRAIIFSFLENIIITNNILLFREFLILFKEKINVNNKNISSKPYIKNYVQKIDKTLIIQILFHLCECMDNKAGNVYEILVKSFNFCPPFDLGMIYFTRYLIYEFILENADKVYNPDFALKIGNLLPDEFITPKGDFLYEQFFEQQLLKMNTDAEKIIIYLTPFVLKIDLNIIMYNFESGETVTPKLFKCGLENKISIDVLFRVTHYDILYNEKYYDTYKNYFERYAYKSIILKVINLKELNQLRNINTDSATKKTYNNNINKNINDNIININDYNINQNYDNMGLNVCVSCSKNYNKQNPFYLCTKCITNELENHILLIYLDYLVKITNLNLKNHLNILLTFENFMNQASCTIQNIRMNLMEVISLSGKNFHDYIKSIKKKICVQCQQNVKYPEGYSLPCGCHLCSDLCFQKYFQFLLIQDFEFLKTSNKKFSVFEYCFCGYKFQFNDYCYFYKIFSKKEFQKTLKLVIINNWNQKCLTCLREFSNQMKFYQLELKDKQLSDIYDIKKFKHIICQYCNKKDIKEIECQICLSIHKVVNVKKYSEDDDDCIIF